jgi:hypothetical protein
MAEILSQEEIDALLNIVKEEDINLMNNVKNKNILSNIFNAFQKIGINAEKINLKKLQTSDLFVSEYSYIDYHTYTHYVFTFGANETFFDYIKNKFSFEKNDFAKWVFYYSFEIIITNQENQVFIKTLFNDHSVNIDLLKETM